MKYITTLSILLFYFASISAQTPMLLKDFNSGGDSEPNLYIEDGGYIYFKTYTNSGVNIQRSDGTIAGTTSLISTNLVDIMEMIIVSGKAYFNAYDSAFELDLYVHDLTPNSPATKITINSSAGSDVGNIIHANGRIYFNASTNSNGYQICSIDIATNTLFEHTAPAPYSTGLFIETNKGYSSTGFKGIVAVNNKLFFNTRFGQKDLLTLDISTASTFPTIVGSTNANGFSPYPFNGKVYMYSGADLISSDGTSITIEIADIGPYFFREFQNRLYFSGEPSVTGSTSVLYSIDATGAIREFSNIPVFGGTTIFNRKNEDYSLVVLDNQLHAFINPNPLSTPSYGFYSIDVSAPNTPVASNIMSDIPKEMFNIEKINGYYYYWYLPFQSNAQQFKKHNGTTGVVITSTIGEGAFQHFKYWNNELYFTGKLLQNQIATCESFSPAYNPGYEWYKLSASQLDCQSVRTANTSFFLTDNIMASTTTININDPILSNTNLCHILSAPNININNTLQINPPATLISNAAGCQ